MDGINFDNMIKNLHFLCAKDLNDLLNKEIFTDVELSDKVEVALFFNDCVNEVKNKNIDNIRIFKENNQMYKEIKLSGIRKFFDKEFIASSNQKYLVGFNHD